MPLKHLDTSFQYLILSKPQFDQPDKLDSFIDYFRSTWFDRFKPILWNHYETIGPRSNNHLEGYNFKINKYIDFIHPKIYNFANTFDLL